MKHPNICEELKHMSTNERQMMADNINVTEELLNAVMRGDEDLTEKEVRMFKEYRDAEPYGVTFNVDYYRSPKLSTYNMYNLKHFRKVCAIWKRAKNAERYANKTHLIFYTTIPSLRTLPRVISRALINRWLLYSAQVEYIQKNRSIPKPPPRGISNTLRG